MALKLILCAAVLLLFSGVPAAVLSRTSNVGERLAVVLIALGSVIGVYGVVVLLSAGGGQSLAIPWALPIGAVNFYVDGIAVIFLLPILIISLCGAVYGLRYWPQQSHPHNGRKLRLSYGILAGSMVLVVITANALAFIISWELMALAGYFLITTEDQQQAVRRAGYVYFVATHIGTAALLVMFILLEQSVGSFNFAMVHSLDGSTLQASIIFVLALIGFGSKAGFMPLHLWLPGGHSSAPSHVSAILSGVMIKTGIYGLVRLLSFYAIPPLWWGWLLLVIGVVSGVMGVAFAIAQHDIKRLLAYHSVENIGIIAMGLGLATLGYSYQMPILAAFGLAGALLHVINHSLFKSLLFYSAGAVIHATGSQNIDHYGGLIKSMPKTAVLFVGAAVAICGLPPLNGFISEWFIYLGFFTAVQHSAVVIALSALLAPALALIGGLAVACFVKVFGITFLGTPRTAVAQDGHDISLAMWLPMSLVFALCVIIGVTPVLVQPLLTPALTAWGLADSGVAAMFSGAQLPWLSICAVALLLLLALVAFWLRWQRRHHPQQVTDTWGCGYQFATARIQYTASSFADMLVGMFSWGLRPKKHEAQINGILPGASEFSSHTADVVLDGVVLPVADRFARLCSTVRHYLQHGILGVYILYITVAVAVLLTVILLGGGM